MSAARSPHRDQSDGGAPPGGASQQAAPLVTVEPGSRRRLVFLFVLALGWSLALLLMDVWTAGRPVVGPGQILKADVVVIARRVPPDQDRLQDHIEVERVFKGEVDQGIRLRVVNLPDVPHVEAGKSYIFALTRFRHDFAVTRLEGQQADLLVYPSSPATIEQTKAILRDAN